MFLSSDFDILFESCYTIQFIFISELQEEKKSGTLSESKQASHAYIRKKES